ncbi:MAG: translation initiation factor IF-2 [Phycisphaerae bacterium]
MAKGIRVSALAKEIGVKSKDVLEKLREEGLGETVPNHASTVSVGLAETIREWFGGGGGGTAVETAAPPKVRAKPAPKRAEVADKKDQADDEAPEGDDETPADDQAVAVPTAEVPPPAAEVPQPAAEVPSADEGQTPPPAASTSQPGPVAPAGEPPSTPAQPSAPAEPPPGLADEATEPVSPPTTPPAATDAPPIMPPPVPFIAPTVTPPAEARPAAAFDPAADREQAPHRPTVTLENRDQIRREPVRVAPQLTKLKPAQISGPKLVREEAPETVPLPRPRGPRPGGPGAPGPKLGFGPIAKGGGGVKVTEEDDAQAKAKKKGLSTRRRGPDGRRGEAMEKIREFTEADIIERRDRLNAAAASRSAFEHHLRKSGRRGTSARALTAAQKGDPVMIEEPVTVKGLSAALGVKSADIIRRLMKAGVFANVNQALDNETAEGIALEFGIELEIVEAKTAEDLLLEEFQDREADADEAGLPSRPPVVTILGHVDHGKTSLLDKIRNSNVVAGEAGGITQHTAAFSVELEREGKKKRVTFIDTPGHQAFTAMRARGANMTDIAVIVIDAAQGIQPQTTESINHAKAAGVAIVVALNKIDLPDANPDRVLGQLAAAGLNPAEWGGDTEVVRTSATTGKGIPDLLDILDIQAEIMELKANPKLPARGVVIEARRDEGMGPVGTVLVQEGTLKVGDVILAGTGFGRIRSLIDSAGGRIKEAGPSTPVLVSGLSEVPTAGDKAYAVNDMDRARGIAEDRVMSGRQKDLASQNKVSLDSILSRMDAMDIKTINLILKGDVQGSVETLQATVTDQNTEEVRVSVIHAAVGSISESDVELASASGAVIIGFNVVPDEKARALAEQRRVEVRTYQVIYEIFDDLKKALSGMLEPEVREKYHGTIEVREVFKVSRLGNIAGCYVTDGNVTRGCKIRLVRDGAIVTDGLIIESLRRLKDDVREVKSGLECGIKLSGYDDIKEGDKFEAYTRETVQRTL